jgi:SAM-dependent methyltransferase
MKKLIDKMRPRKEFDRITRIREADGKLFFRRFHKCFCAVKCPACGSSSSRPVFRRLGFRHIKCRACLTVFCSPRPTEELLATYYNEFKAPKYWTRLLLATDAARKAVQYGPRAALIIGWLKALGKSRGGVALDYGCGSGAFAVCLKRTGFFKKVLGLDFSEDCVRTARKFGIEASADRLQDLTPASVDIVFANDLIEHLYDPRTFLKACRKVLRPNGTVVVATPNGEGFDFKILKELAPNVAPPEHLNYFNPGSIKRLFKQQGFKVRNLATPGRLDVEIVRCAAQRGFPLSKHNEYLCGLLNSEEKVREKFQAFLAENMLSSHMLVLAQKQDKS